MTRLPRAVGLLACSAVLATAGMAFPGMAGAYVEPLPHGNTLGVVVTDDSAATQVAKAASAASTFHLLTPFMAYRSNGRLGRAASAPISLAGSHGLPAPGGFDAVVATVTVSHASTATSISIYPAGGSPSTVVVAAVKGATATGTTIVATGRSGRIIVRNAAGRADVAVDILGYAAAGRGGQSFHPLVTAPVMAPQTIGPGRARTVRIVGARNTGLPPDGAVSAVALDVRVLRASAATAVAAYPSGTPAPTSHPVVRARKGAPTSGLAVVPVAPNGTVTLRNAHGSARVAAAVEGYWTAEATGGAFHPVSPVVTSTASLRSGQLSRLTVAGVGDVPAAARDGAVLLGVTGTRASRPTQVTVEPRGSTGYAQLDVPAGGGSAAAAIAVPVAHDKDVVFGASAGTVHVDVSVLGWFEPAARGNDVSTPQCTNPLPTGGAFGVVAATDELPYSSPTPACFGAELAWATSRAAPPAYYLNLVDRGAASPYWPSGATSPRPCPTTAADWDVSCTYDYGYRAAEQAVQFATANGAPPGRWWVDVEIGDGEYWGSATPDVPGHLDANAATVRGALDYLKSRHMPIGVYSTTVQWQEITGQPAGFADAATWGAGSPTAADARSHCIPTSFTGGPALLEQVVNTGTDYSC